MSNNRTREQSLAAPMAGDRWKLRTGEVYEFLRREGRWCVDKCIQGIDVDQGELYNTYSDWRGHMATAEFLGGGSCD